jgi:hypothetical protein
MPLSAGNPNRDRNFLVLILSGVFVFSLIMVLFVFLQVRGSDMATDAFVRFLTLVILNLIPAGLAAWYSFAAHRTSTQVRDDISNGVLKNKVKEAVAEVAAGDGVPVSYSGESPGRASTQDNPPEGSSP